MSDNNSNVQVQVIAALKSTGVAFLFWLFLGAFGGHRFYLGFIKSGVLMFFMTILAWIFFWGALLVAIGGEPEASGGMGAFSVFIFVAYVIWLIVDVCRLSTLTKKANALLRENAKSALI